MSKEESAKDDHSKKIQELEKQLLNMRGSTQRLESKAVESIENFVYGNEKQVEHQKLQLKARSINFYWALGTAASLLGVIGFFVLNNIRVGIVQQSNRLSEFEKQITSTRNESELLSGRLAKNVSVQADFAQVVSQRFNQVETARESLKTALESKIEKLALHSRRTTETSSRQSMHNKLLIAW